MKKKPKPFDVHAPKKRKRGRPKGSKNKKNTRWDSVYNAELVPTENVNLEPIPSRLDVLMSELETEINRAITKLKGTV